MIYSQITKKIYLDNISVYVTNRKIEVNLANVALQAHFLYIESKNFLTFYTICRFSPNP